MITRPESAATGFARGLREILVSPSLAFFRLAAGGGWVAPLVLAAVTAAAGLGAKPLQALVITLLGPWAIATASPAAGLALLAGATFLLFPLYYAGAVAGLAAVGSLIGRGSTGLTFREAFGRCWRVLGWTTLPVIIIAALTAGPVWLIARPDLNALIAAAPTGALPSVYLMPFAAGLTTLVALAAAAWTLYLLLAALRHALAATTGQVWATVLITALLFGALAHTPAARWAGAGYSDTWQSLKTGRGGAFVDLRAFRGTEAAPARGDLVAFAPAALVEAAPTRFFFAALGMGELNSGYTPYLGRVIGLAGDTVEVREGRLHLNGVARSEDYLAHLGDDARAFPPDLTIAPLTVPSGHLYVLPDNRSRLAEGGFPGDYGPVIAAARVKGRVTVYTMVVEVGGRP